jgi:hypothetical protein
LSAVQAATACLTEDELLALGRGGLADSPAAEAHLAGCATCAALLAEVVAHDAAEWNALAGKQLGPYRLDAQIGSGGMGAVYRAWDTRLDRAIAIKVLHATADAERLAREARATATIDHPAIVSIHDVGVSDGIAYVAMELVDGESLRSVIERGAVGIERARELAAELADGLAAAHARGVIHRDLKPENLILARGRLRILDFGLAKVLDGAALDATEPGTVQGTAGYMAPEQARGEPADARADLFATGAIVYELVTGQRAFPGATPADRLSAILRDTPTLDGPLAPIVERCLAKEPRDRFHSAADLAWALRSPASMPVSPDPVAGRSRVSRRTVLGAAIAGAGAALVAGVGGFLVGRRRSTAPARHPTFQQLTYRTGRIYTARFVGDGSRFVYGGAWDGEPLRGFVADLRGGGTSPIEPAGDVLALSTRGELALCIGKRFTDHQSATGTLAVMPLGGGAPRTLAENVQDADYDAGGRLAIIRRGESGFRLELPLGTTLVEGAWLTHARISPDGRRIAYVQHPHTNDDAGDLMLVDVATKQTQKLAGDFSSIAGLAWHGSTIWFTASRDSPYNEVFTITPGGRERSVAEGTGRLRLHDLSGNRALVTLDAWRLRMLVGDRDRSLSDISFVSDISADGTTLVVGELGHPDNVSGAMLVPVDGGKPLRLGDGFPLAISPSGQRVAAKLNRELVVYTTANAEHPVIPAPPRVTAARWIDESSLVAVADGKLWRLSLAGAPVEIAPRAEGPLAVDPVRRRVAFVVDGKLHVVELATGAVRTFDAGRRVACGWLAEPDALVLQTPTTPIELTRVDATTGATSPHLVIEPPAVGLKAVDSVVLHHDGKRYAYSYGQELSQLFLMTV